MDDRQRRRARASGALMKSISAYIAEDGSLHETRESAAVRDLMGVGFTEPVARLILEHRADLGKVFREASGLDYLPVHYPAHKARGGEDAA